MKMVRMKTPFIRCVSTVKELLARFIGRNPSRDRERAMADRIEAAGAIVEK
jgi:hypothetical protein